MAAEHACCMPRNRQSYVHMLASASFKGCINMGLSSASALAAGFQIVGGTTFSALHAPPMQLPQYEPSGLACFA